MGAKKLNAIPRFMAGFPWYCDPYILYNYNYGYNMLWPFISQLMEP